MHSLFDLPLSPWDPGELRKDGLVTIYRTLLVHRSVAFNDSEHTTFPRALSPPEGKKLAAPLLTNTWPDNILAQPFLCSFCIFFVEIWYLLSLQLTEEYPRPRNISFRLLFPPTAPESYQRSRFFSQMPNCLSWLLITQRQLPQSLFGCHISWGMKAKWVCGGGREGACWLRRDPVHQQSQFLHRSVTSGYLWRPEFFPGTSRGWERFFVFFSCVQ